VKSVGIYSAEALREIGSMEAVFRLKAQYPSTCVVILYHLEAALQGIEMKELDSSRKAELKAFFNQIKDC
jgi:DNA transformation protein